MILEISFNGYRFFDDTSISFAADARTKKLLANALDLDEKNVLKAVGVYGPNNSGKSNICFLLGTIKKLLSGKEDFVFNSKLFNDKKSCDISITYNNNDGLGWLKYEFTYDSSVKQFIREKLTEITYYKKGAPFIKNVFEKDLKSKAFNVFNKDKFDLIKIVPASKPILYSIKTDFYLSSLKKYLDSLKRLADSIVIIRMYNMPIQNTINTLKGNDMKKRKFVLEFVKHADLSIADFKYSSNIKFSDTKKVIESALIDVSKLPDAFHLTTTYGNKEVPSLFYDSSGTKKIQAIASYIYDAIAKQKVLIVDELDNGLHFKLTRAIVSAFNNIGNTSGQLFFTAHDLLLIDCKNLMRKDQIYFLQRTDKGASLFHLKKALASKGGPREGAALLKRYNYGDFGYVPMPNFISEILSINSAKK